MEDFGRAKAAADPFGATRESPNASNFFLGLLINITFRKSVILNHVFQFCKAYGGCLKHKAFPEKSYIKYTESLS